MNRKTIVYEIAKKLVLNLSIEDRNNAVLNVWYVIDQQDIDEGFDLNQAPFDVAIIQYFIHHEFDDDINYGEFFDSAIIYDLTIRYQIYNNAKLQQIYKALYHRDVDIEEDSRAYYLQCPCCGFYGLSLEPDWDVCSICLWEYVGQDETRYSPANRMTMIEYRQKFYEEHSKAALEQKYISDQSI